MAIQLAVFSRAGCAVRDKVLPMFLECPTGKLSLWLFLCAQYPEAAVAVKRGRHPLPR